MGTYEIDCFKYMAADIHWKTIPLTSTDFIPDKKNMADHLHKAAMATAVLADPTESGNRPTSKAYFAWSNILKDVYKWPDRKTRAHDSFILLRDCLEKAREAWRVNRYSETPTLIDREAGQHIADYVNYRAMPMPQCGKLNALIVYNALRMSGTLGLSDVLYEYPIEDYQVWAEIINKKYNWTDKRDVDDDGYRGGNWLWNRLREAREMWARREKQQQRMKTNTQVKPKNEIETKNEDSGDMESLFATTFSDIAIADEGNELQDDDANVFRKCDFCSKETVVHPTNSKILEKLSRNGFFCASCIRHSFNTKKRNHVLILSLRGLIGYLFHFSYWGRKPRLYLSQIEDLIDLHVQIGELNPLFSYDPDTYCWFVDFMRVGKTPNKLPVTDVIRTVNEMVSAFNPYENIADFKANVFTERFAEAVNDFYEKRYRPDGKPLCIPSLVGCANDMRESVTGKNQTTTKKIDIAIFRDFLPNQLKLHTRR